MLEEYFSALSKNYIPTLKKVNPQIQLNRAYNEELRGGLIAGKEYPIDKKSIELKAYPTSIILSKKLPSYFKQQLLNESKRYTIKGSYGMGSYTEIPWVAIYDKEVTNSAEHGYYIVLLFKADMSGCYLSLNQGYTQYSKLFKGEKRKQQELIKTASKARGLLSNIEGSIDTELDLSSNADKAMGYGAGNIFGFYFSLTSKINESKFNKSLQQLLSSYAELKELIGKDILNINNILTEEEYQETVHLEKTMELSSGPIPKSEPAKSENGGPQWLRNPKIAANALKKAKYRCSLNFEHITFVSNKTKNNFVEAHHLIPMQYQKFHEFCLDVPENIVSLCPNCHRAIHHATNEQKYKMLSRLLSEREQDLAERGISITRAELEKLYTFN